MNFAKKALLAVAAAVALPVSAVFAQTPTPTLTTAASDVGTTTGQVLGTTTIAATSSVTPTVTTAADGGPGFIVWIIAILIFAALAGLIFFILFGRNNKEKKQ